MLVFVLRRRSTGEMAVAQRMKERRIKYKKIMAMGRGVVVKSDHSIYIYDEHNRRAGQMQWLNKKKEFDDANLM